MSSYAYRRRRIPRAASTAACGKPASRAPSSVLWPQHRRLARTDRPARKPGAVTVCSAIYDAVTTTDELIPSGETSSYRSNPLGLAEFTLSRKDPAYVGRTKAVKALELKRRAGDIDADVKAALHGLDPKTTGLGSLVMALRPGDGSAREQAASCQRVLGGVANIATEYATKRYRSNVVNWGMLPFVTDGLEELGIAPGDQVLLKGIRSAVESGAEEIDAVLIQNGEEKPLKLRLPAMTAEERDIVLAGCLINYYAKN